MQMQMQMRGAVRAACKGPGRGPVWKERESTDCGCVGWMMSLPVRHPDSWSPKAESLFHFDRKRGTKVSSVCQPYAISSLPLCSLASAHLSAATSRFNMRVTALFPLACAIVGFILSMLALFAGSTPSFMEDYHIITVRLFSSPPRLQDATNSPQLNTSTLGHNILGADSEATSTSAAATATATSTAGRIGDWLTDIKDNVTDSVEGEFDDLVSDVADKLAAELGINQWYSLHLMTLCHGDYKPNATAREASKNVTSCTHRTAMCELCSHAERRERETDGML